MKTEFDLMHVGSSEIIATAMIVGNSCIVIEYDGDDDNALKVVLPNKDIERFAVNILKALKSKHLKTKP